MTAQQQFALQQLQWKWQLNPRAMTAEDFMHLEQLQAANNQDLLAELNAKADELLKWKEDAGRFWVKLETTLKRRAAAAAQGERRLLEGVDKNRALLLCGHKVDEDLRFD